MAQNENKIQNPEKQVPKTPQMNERDFTNDLLSMEKYLNSSYAVAQNEASHPGLYQTIYSVSNETQDMQRKLFTLMFEKGWYSLEKAEQQNIAVLARQFSGYKDQFPYQTGLQ